MKNEGTNRFCPFTIDNYLQHLCEQMELKMKQRLVYEDQDFIFAENIGHPRVMKQMVLRLQRLMKHMDVDKHITPP